MPSSAMRSRPNDSARSRLPDSPAIRSACSASRRRSQIVGRLVCKIARTIRPARDDDGALGFRLNRVVSADEDKVVNPVLPPLGLSKPRVVPAQDQPVDDRASLLRRRQRQGVVQHPRDRPADRLHEPGDPAGRGPDGVGVDLLAEAADGDALCYRLGGQVEEHRVARLGLEAVRVEERPDAPAEITRRLGSVANRERNNLGLDGKGVGPDTETSIGRADANSANTSKTLSSA